MLTSKQIAQFHREGLLFLESFYDYENDIEPIQKGIYGIIGIIIKKHALPITRPPFSAHTFDSGFQDIIGTNRTYGADIYDAVKQIPAFIRLVANRKNEEIARALFNTALPGVAAAGYGIRIDNPFEDRFRAQWHQEYLSQLRSKTGVVFWSPLITMTPDLGAVELCPGSHTLGVLPVTSTDPGNSEKTGAYALRLVNETKLISQFKTIAPLTRPGDLLLVDWLLLHRSGQNISDRSRWSMQMRYFDFCEKTGVDLSWCGSFSSGVNVRDIHPEYFTD